MAGIPGDVYALTPSEILMRDSQALEAMGVAPEDRKEFENNPALGITRRHRLVVMLGALPKALGRTSIIRLANQCATPDQADFLLHAVAILASRQQSGAADYTAIQVIGRLPGATTASGELHVPAPVDYVTWTPEVAAFASRDDLPATPRFLLHTGRLSRAAAAGISAAGWQITPVPYP
jgi:hypothetical protein